MLLLRETGRLEARDLLRAIEGPTLAVAGLAGEEGAAERLQYVHHLRLAARDRNEEAG